MAVKHANSDYLAVGGIGLVLNLKRAEMDVQTL